MANVVAGIEPDQHQAIATNGAGIAGILGAAIRERRTFLRMSQEELAVRSGLHRTYLSDVERGARNPSIKTIEKIAQALQVPVVKLFEPNPSQTSPNHHRI
jgi:transcriptional regulator with XRE-family HTH domain